MTTWVTLFISKSLKRSSVAVARTSGTGASMAASCVTPSVTVRRAGLLSACLWVSEEVVASGVVSILVTSGRGGTGQTCRDEIQNQSRGGTGEQNIWVRRGSFFLSGVV